MLKAFVEKIIDTAQPIFKEIEGRTFVVLNDGDITEITPMLYRPETLRLNSLDSLVKMIHTEALERYDTPIYITVPNHETVHCFSQPYDSLREERVLYYIVDATDVPGWKPEQSLKFEEAIIAIQTRFQESADTPYLLKLLNEISTGSKVTYSDNGIATSIVTQSGISLQTKEAIRPIVTLKPYRTFQEVEQPESKFLIRINERGINFIEADGGMWKLKARQTVKEYLETALCAEVESGKVVIAL